MVQSTEEKVLKLSMFILLVFAVLGIIFGIILNSEVILFDGIFSVISIVTSYLTLLVSRYIKKKDDIKFPFGKEGIEPLVVCIQYAFLNVVLLYMFVDATRMILSGGNELNLNFAIIYLLVTTIILHFFVKKLVETAKKSHSTIIKAEILQWEISLKQSWYVLGGYCLGLILLLLRDNNISSYIDPIILIVFIIVTFTQTIDEMGIAFKELIGMSTIGKDTYKKMDMKINQIKQEYGIKDYYMRLKKVGGMLVLEIDFLVDRDFNYGTVILQDQIREVVFQRINEAHFDLWLSISFTTQYKWIE